MGQVNCEKKLALAWSQQQSQALASLQGCLGLSRCPQASAYHLSAPCLLARGASWEEYVQKLLSQWAIQLSLAL